MRVLLLGGCGYIGSALYTHLKSRVHRVPSIDLEWFGRTRPLALEYPSFRSDYAESTTLIEEADTVVLVAAHSSVQMCQRDPYGAFQNNVANFVSLLRKIEAIKSNRPKLIYASSSCVYTGHKQVCHETALLLPPVDHLTLTKQTIDHYAGLSDVEFYGLRFGSVNGWSPNLRTDLMINAMTRDALIDGVVRVSNPEMYRPILGMPDLCRAVACVVENDKDQRGIYNVASFNETIRDIGQRVATLQNAKLQVWGSPGGYDFQMSSAKFCNTFDFNFHDTVESIVQSLVDHNIDGEPSRLRNTNVDYQQKQKESDD